MIVYHGTVDAYLPSIEKLGLKVVPKNRFEAVTPTIWGDIELPLEKGIYVSSDKHQAEVFALLRAAWLSIPVGKGINANISTVPLLKRAGEVVKAAKPIVLELDLTESLAAHLHQDEAWREGGDKAFWIDETIPSSCIKSVTTPEQKVKYYADSV